MTVTTVTTIDRSELTLLVLPASADPAKRLDAYPIDLGQAADETTVALAAVAELEGVAVKELALAGLEFVHPEQLNTTVTLGHTDLDEVVWVLGDGGLVLNGANGVLRALEHLTSIEVPVYA